MRIDHIAYRVSDRDEAAQFFEEAMGYKIADDFTINFEDGSEANCYSMEPPESNRISSNVKTYGNYHLAPEIFVSEGTEGSIVWNWVVDRDGVGGIHHIAYEVDSVEGTMKEWREKGYAEFTTEDPLTCPGLIQCFTKPSKVTGVIYEFIERQDKGFCRENVKDLMQSTKDI